MCSFFSKRKRKKKKNNRSRSHYITCANVKSCNGETVQLGKTVETIEVKLKCCNSEGSAYFVMLCMPREDLSFVSQISGTEMVKGSTFVNSNSGQGKIPHFWH